MVGTVEEVTVFSLKAEEDFEATFKKSDRAVKSLTRKMEEYQKSIGKSRGEITILKAQQKGATDEQLRYMKAIQASIVEEEERAVALKRSRDATLLNEKALEGLIADLNRQSNAIGKTTQQLQIEKAVRLGATQAQIKQIQAMHRNILAQKQTTKTSKGVTGQLRLMRGGFGQIGHQVQDVAVQLQMGTNAMLVFGQQGSQVASLFGPHGAMIGALLAVGAAFGTYLTASKGAKIETDSLAESVRETAKELGILDNAARDYLISLETTKIREFNKQIEDSTELEKDAINTRLADTAATDAANRMLTRNTGISRVNTGAVLLGIQVARESEEQTYANSAAEKEAAGVRGQLNAKIKTAQEQIKMLNAGRVEEVNNTGKVIDSLNEEIKTYGKNARALAYYKAIKDGASIGEIKAIEIAYNKLDALAAETAATEAATAATDAATAAAAAMRKSNDALIAGYELQAASVGMTADEIVMLKLAGRDLNDEDRRRIELALQIVADYKAKTAASKEYAKQMDDEAALIESMNNSSATKDQAAKDDFADLKMSMATELELILAHQEAKLAIVQAYADTGLAGEKEISDARKAIADDTTAHLMASAQMHSQSMMSTVSQQLSLISGMFDQTTVLGKAAFVASQAIAAGQAIITAQAGASAAVAAAGMRAAAVALVDPTGVLAKAHIAEGAAQASAITAMGYVSAGLIAAQTVASFDGGGYTGSGQRSGGLDGKGGFMAMMHPNETVTDHTKGGGQGITINVSAHDATGFKRLLKQEQGTIIRLMNNARNNSGRRSLA